MSPRIKYALWWSVFIIIFALSQDYWTWDQMPQPSFGGFPAWLYTFILLQFALAIALAIFTVTTWQTPPDEKNEDHE